MMSDDESWLGLKCPRNSVILNFSFVQHVGLPGPKALSNQCKNKDNFSQSFKDKNEVERFLQLLV